MLTFYKFRVDNSMLPLSKVPEPYQGQMRKDGYTDIDEAGEDQ